MFRIEYAEGVAEDLRDLRAYDRSWIIDTIEEQLRYQPTKETRNRKLLEGFGPQWENVHPIWELRVGDFRVFYDVEEVSLVVTIRAIRKKPPHITTEEIL